MKTKKKKRKLFLKPNVLLLFVLTAARVKS